jgi:type II secretory pathway pseudopilin PulG
MSNRKSKIQNPKSRSGFTLVEVLIAATLSLVLVGLTVQVLATIGTTASDTRSVVQMTDRLRSARIVLQQDLSNVTVDMCDIPQRSELNRGYFEIIEGPDGPIFFPTTANPGAVSVDLDQSNNLGTAVTDTTVGDPDDVLMFTAQMPVSTYFYGRLRAASTVVDGGGRMWTVPVDTMGQSTQAEICYFMRGNTLYRRVLLIVPSSDWASTNGQIDPTIFLWSQYPTYVSAGTTNLPQPIWDIAFYDKFDVSARQEGGLYDTSNAFGGLKPPVLVPNTLGDLTKRQNRYGHQPWVYPNDARFWDTRYWTSGAAVGTAPPANVLGGFLGLPTLRECTAYTGNGNNGVARWPFPLFDAYNATTLPPYVLQNVIPANGVSVVTVGGGTATVAAASQNLWGVPVAYNAAMTITAGAQAPVFPYNTGLLPLIYPYPTNTPAGTTVANFQPYSTIPGVANGTAITTLPATNVWSARMNLSTNNLNGVFDVWRNPYSLDQQDYTQAPRTGSLYAFSSAYQPPGVNNVNFSTRYADDVLLTHVLSFDVKVWDSTAPTIQTTATFGGIPPGTYLPGDPGYVEIFAAWAASGLATLQTNLQPSAAVSSTPGAFGGYGFVVAQGAYVDMNYLGTVILPFLSAAPTQAQTQMAQALASVSNFAGPGVAQLPQFGQAFSSGSGLAMLYDTGCFDYENDGIDQNQDGIIDDFTNGIDDNGIGGVDDSTEMEGSTPYPVPLEGIQIKIRVYDPDSRQIREVTITSDFTSAA